MRFLICFLTLLILPTEMHMAQTPAPAKKAPETAKAAGAQAWPRPIPARVRDGSNKDLFVMTLGDVNTVLADGTYDPSKDEVTLKDGPSMKNYYRDTLGIKFFKPIDKSIFPLPPSGLCTWYYYYQDINENEVKRNADWIAKNLKDYGAQHVQIDDGWQGETKEGRHGSRDWTTVDKAFPGGMASLAAYIKSLGLTPGIWVAPHGQSNEDVVKKNPGVFMLKPDGTSASDSWEGKWLVDPSVPETQKYLKDLFTMMVKWGYDYFKIDGQPTVVTEFNRAKAFMKNPDDIDTLYRNTIDSIRSAIGPNRYLLGCWGIPLQGVGQMNGSRSGGDVVLGWSGFYTALSPTMNYYFLHNIVWYTDPDTMLLRPPLTLDQARVWATLQGLTGQALMSSDRLMDLSEDRVELMRRVYPAVDIRPLDLFPSRQNKRIWDLKVSHLGRNYDVVGVFNFGEARSDSIYLNWKELGLPDSGPVHVFDFWNKEYLGAWEAGMALDIPPTSCRVLTLMPSSDKIRLVSTNRHITQGWVDLISLNSGPAANSFAGKSRLIKNDPYEIHFVFPRGKNFAIKTATAQSAAGALPVRTVNHQGWGTVRIDSPRTTDVSWSVVFEPTDSYQYPTKAPTGLRVEPVGLDGGNLSWGAQYYLNAGYQVYLDGNLLGYSGNTSFPLRGLDPSRTYTAEVRAVWEDGTIGPTHAKTELKFTIQSLLPNEILLSSLTPVPAAGRGPGRGGAGRGGSAAALAIGGKRYEGGINARGGSEIEYDIAGIFATFSAQVGVDDGYEGSLSLAVVGDGKELWNSGTLKKSDSPKQVNVNIAGVKRLILRATTLSEAPQAQGQAQGRGRGMGFAPQAAWLDAKVSGRSGAK
jgi:hypothetical protein